MYFSLGQAAKETGKSKSTISKALKNGKLSYLDKDSSGYKIDPAELFRVYPKGEQAAPEKEQSETPRTNGETPNKIKMLELRLDTAHEKNEALKDTIKALEADKEDYKERLDTETEERRKLVLMLTHERKETQIKKGFLARLLGK